MSDRPLASARHGVVAEVLVGLGDEAGWEGVNPYVVTHTATHARLGDRFDVVLGDDAVLDHHDQERLAAEVQATYFGTGRADERAAGLLRVHEALLRADVADRAPLRELGRLSNGAPPAHRERSSGWWPQWLASEASTAHLTLSGPTGVVWSLAFGALGDGRVVLAAGRDDGTVRLWDPASGAEVRGPLRGQSGVVRSVAFGTLADGRVVLTSGGQDGTVRLWDPVSGRAGG